VLHVCRAAARILEAAHLHAVQVALPLVGGLEVAEGDVTADLAAQQGQLSRAVQALVDARDVRAALEGADGLLVQALALQSQAEAQQLLRETRRKGAARLEVVDRIAVCLHRARLRIAARGGTVKDVR
jgi:hypothetical protein